MQKLPIVSIALLMLFSTEIVAYRPFGTEDAGVAGAGKFQLETSWDYLAWQGGTKEKVLLLVPIFGLSDNLELSCELPYLFHALADGSGKRGMGDASLVLKYLLRSESDNFPAAVLKVVEKLDSGDYVAGLGSGDRDHSLVFAVSKHFGRTLFHCQAGYAWIGKMRNPSQRDISLFGFGFDHALNDRFRLAIEMSGNRHPDINSVADPMVGLIGLICQLSDKVLLDAASRWGLSSASPSWSMTAGMSINL